MRSSLTRIVTCLALSSANASCAAKGAGQPRLDGDVVGAGLEERRAQHGGCRRVLGAERHDGRVATAVRRRRRDAAGRLDGLVVLVADAADVERQLDARDAGEARVAQFGGERRLVLHEDDVLRAHPVDAEVVREARVAERDGGDGELLGRACPSCAMASAGGGPPEVSRPSEMRITPARRRSSRPTYSRSTLLSAPARSVRSLPVGSLAALTAAATAATGSGRGEPAASAGPGSVLASGRTSWSNSNTSTSKRSASAEAAPRCARSARG